jgi:tricorn protease
MPSLALAQEPIRFARAPDVSPDGRQVAFSYQGDIWVVEAIGGVARPVTVHEAHDTLPVFSPDGRSIAFSSNREGSYDVYVVPTHGGKPRRLTFDSAADRVSGWSPDGKHVLFSSFRNTDFPPVLDLYLVPVQGGREQRVTAFEGRDGVFNPRGDQIAYVRGAGIWYRKNYRGSSNDDIWIYRADGSQNRQLTSFNGQDGSPMWSADGKSVFYVSEQFGTSNICRLNADGSGQPQQVTFHQGEGVLRARISSNGEWLVYECGADLYVCSTAGPTPSCRKLAIEAFADDKTNPEVNVTFNQALTEYALTPDERYAAVVFHGEIFLTPLTDKTTKAKRLTDHPAHDHDLAWSPDIKKLLFVSDRDGEENIYALEHNDTDHPDLIRAHQYKVTRLTKTTLPESGVGFSPDGKLVSFLRDGRLWTMKPDGSDQRQLVNEPIVFEYEWSPDSKWIAFARLDSHFASEIYVIPAAGGEAKNVTRYATRNFGMAWTSDSRKIAFIGQRRQDLDLFLLSLTKPAREGDTSKGDIDFNDIHHRVERVTSLSSEESELALRPDGSQVVFRSNALGADDLWLAATNGSQITRLTTGGLRPTQLRWTRSGTIFFLDGQGALRFVRLPILSPAAPGLTLPGGLTVPGEIAVGRVAFTAKMKINRQEQFTQMFDEGWRKLQHRFYDPKLHGADWNAVRDRYRPLVKHVSMTEDFYDLVSLMLGELNASHLGVGGRIRPAEEQTADLGLLFDPAFPGPGLKIREILKRGPADRRGIDLKPGDIVLAINGIELTPTVNLSDVLNDKANEVVTLQVVADAKETKRRRVELRAAPRQAVADLLYERWAALNAERVKQLSGGKLGYIHLRGMDATSLDEFVRTLYTENFDKEGIVLDVRYNGGGFTHEQVMNYLGGKEHTYFVTREGSKGTVLRASDRRWTRPVVLICNNRSYSDAEIFPHAFRSLGLGKIVGLPTGGFVIGTYNDRLIDGSSFRVPRLGVYTAAGVNLEKAGIVPDVLVDLHPDELAQGKDAQLEKAVVVLQEDVKKWKASQKPEAVASPQGDKKPEPAKGASSPPPEK